MPSHETEFLCRGCLVETGDLKNMNEWKILDDFFRITDIKNEKIEGISELLCTSCELTLNTCKEFQQLCQKSNLLLRSRLLAKVSSSKIEVQQSTAEHTPLPVQQTTDKPIKNEITSILDQQKLLLLITAPNQEEKINLPCPHLCTDVFTKKNDLHKHLDMVHHITKDFTIDLQYYCAEIDCPYHVGSDRNKWFSGRKFLNQHINNLHKEKIYKCNKCLYRFSTETMFRRHQKSCKTLYMCHLCNCKYSTNETLMVHLLRRHPEIHKHYKNSKKRFSSTEKATKRFKEVSIIENLKEKPTECSEVLVSATVECQEKSEVLPISSKELDFIDSPKKSFATQIPEDIRNDVTLPCWIKTDEISTQTVFEDSLSIKSQNSDDGMFFPETVSLADIQTQTVPIEFGLSRLNKKTQSCVNSETQSPDLSIKETQTCFCHYDSPKLQSIKLFDSLSSSPASVNLTSSETQTGDKFLNSDDLLSFNSRVNSAETQTCFDGSSNDIM